MGRWIKMVNKNSFLEWSKVFVPLLSALSVASVGAYYTYKSAENVNAKEYIKIGVGIINSPKSEYNESMREWATELINHYAPIKLKPELKTEIIQGKAIPLDSEFGLFVDPILETKKAYTFEWDHKLGYTYGLTVEQYVNGKWVFATGMSTPHSRVTTYVPRDKPLRWKVTSYEIEGKDQVTTDWINLSN